MKPMENKKIESLRQLHDCLLFIPRKEAIELQKFALWLNYRDGVGRKLDRETLTFKNRPEL